MFSKVVSGSSTNMPSASSTKKRQPRAWSNPLQLTNVTFKPDHGYAIGCVVPSTYMYDRPEDIPAPFLDLTKDQWMKLRLDNLDIWVEHEKEKAKMGRVVKDLQEQLGDDKYVLMEFDLENPHHKHLFHNDILNGENIGLSFCHRASYFAGEKQPYVDGLELSLCKEPLRKDCFIEHLFVVDKDGKQHPLSIKDDPNRYKDLLDRPPQIVKETIVCASGNNMATSSSPPSTSTPATAPASSSSSNDQQQQQMLDSNEQRILSQFCAALEKNNGPEMDKSFDEAFASQQCRQLTRNMMTNVVADRLNRTKELQDRLQRHESTIKELEGKLATEIDKSVDEKLSILSSQLADDDNTREFVDRVAAFCKSTEMPNHIKAPLSSLLVEASSKRRRIDNSNVPVANMRSTSLAGNLVTTTTSASSKTAEDVVKQSAIRDYQTRNGPRLFADYLPGSSVMEFN